MSVLPSQVGLMFIILEDYNFHFYEILLLTFKDCERCWQWRLHTSMSLSNYLLYWSNPFNLIKKYISKFVVDIRYLFNQCWGSGFGSVKKYGSTGQPINQNLLKIFLISKHKSRLQKKLRLLKMSSSLNGSSSISLRISENRKKN